MYLFCFFRWVTLHFLIVNLRSCQCAADAVTPSMFNDMWEGILSSFHSTFNLYALTCSFISPMFLSQHSFPLWLWFYFCLQLRPCRILKLVHSENNFTQSLSEGLLVTCTYDYLTEDWNHKSFVLFAFIFNYCMPMLATFFFYSQIVKGSYAPLSLNLVRFIFFAKLDVN